MSSEKDGTGATLPKPFGPGTLVPDIRGGLVVFLVALPLCLGIALASGATGEPGALPLMSGLIAGIVGGLVVGSISGSHTSVSGPAAGLTAIVIAQVENCGSVEAFLLAVVLAGVLQIAMGICKAGALSAFFPSSVIKGLLAAIGVILILKQIPHVLGHDSDPEGEMSFAQPDHENTFSELVSMVDDFHIGAAAVGLLAIGLLVLWQKFDVLRKSIVPGPLAAVLFGVSLHLFFLSLGGNWAIGPEHLVQIPVAESAADLSTFLTFPDIGAFLNPAIYVAAVTIAIVASLETLLNLEAVDKLDPLRRNSPPNRELVAQGAGNIVSGMLGGLPVTSVIVRGSVNVNIGAKTKVSTIVHGILLVLSVVFIPQYLNMIPLSALAAILLVTGFKLASPALFKQMYREGRYQFLPFFITLVAIVFTDLLIGILIGLLVSALFILNSNLRRPLRRVVESHLDGEVTYVELSPQVSFLNRGALDKLFSEAKPNSNLLIDATHSDYIDPDILSMIREFKDTTAPARGIKVSLRGFRDKYKLRDEVLFADYATRELKERITPDQVLMMLREGNARFHTGQRLSRDLGRQINATRLGQNPFAAVLSCIDSRVPVELILDQGIGDVFSIRVAGNIVGTKTLASLEYAVAVSGVKLVLVLGHTQCGAVTSSIEFVGRGDDVAEVTGCSHLGAIVNEVAASVSPEECQRAADLPESERELFIDEVVKRNVLLTAEQILHRSDAIAAAVVDGRVRVVGAVYDIASGKIDFFEDESWSPEKVSG
ncbi:bifunctional SulP family inorganic anion transporter/carbonic anhydrase [Roseiconus lacunae]|uniref:SulP family inorganic anion transporter n=1 Tax=Roseiconus lacunae TaxID=2605694 RepID=A0ABT7PM87_9BACT|nr:SulP family inorganic anion transporter [Roseiconus lacunae]MCD0461535.1 sulfate transporter [Roseiconus lacunae]MDM4017612.1 SulP family inorganic anion transporter [Roseiconus lacunae]WRQ51125.1 SulP family inorganic anion transporter [Stieleria sp. HD01]